MCVFAQVLVYIALVFPKQDDPPPPEDDENKEKRTDDISSWDVEFLKVDQGTLFELILVRLHASHMQRLCTCVVTSRGFVCL